MRLLLALFLVMLCLITSCSEGTAPFDLSSVKLPDGGYTFLNIPWGVDKAAVEAVLGEQLIDEQMSGTAVGNAGTPIIKETYFYPEYIRLHGNTGRAALEFTDGRLTSVIIGFLMNQEYSKGNDLEQLARDTFAQTEELLGEPTERMAEEKEFTLWEGESQRAEITSMRWDHVGDEWHTWFGINLIRQEGVARSFTIAVAAPDALQ